MREERSLAAAAAASRWQLFSGAAGAGGLQHVQHTKRDKTHTSPIDIIIKPPGISLLYVKRRRLINWIIVSFHSPSPRPSDDSWCWLQAEKVVIFRGRWLIAMAFIVDYYISAPWTLPRVVASYHPTSPPPSLVKCMLACCFTLWCESRLCDRGVVRLMCCARRSRSRSLFHSYSLASFWCNFIFRVFYILTGTFFLLCLIIWLLDVQHRLGRAHISQHDDWVTHNLFSFSIVWRYVPGEGDGTSGLRVCVLNFYDFIIPYFKPFVHCSSLHL